MHNPNLNGSEQFSQISNPNQHLQQTHQEQQVGRSQQHEGYQPGQVAIENYQIPQTSDADTRIETFSNSIEDIPLDPYHAHSPTEPETVPLMYEQNEHIIETAPLVDRIELRIYNPFAKSRSVRQISIIGFILGFVIFAFGISLMVTSLTTIKCYSHCEEDSCKDCQVKMHTKVMISAIVFFILTSLCILGKIIKFTVVY